MGDTNRFVMSTSALAVINDGRTPGEYHPRLIITWRMIAVLQAIMNRVKKPMADVGLHVRIEELFLGRERTASGD